MIPERAPFKVVAYGDFVSSCFIGVSSAGKKMSRAAAHVFSTVNASAAEQNEAGDFLHFFRMLPDSSYVDPSAPPAQWTSG